MPALFSNGRVFAATVERARPGSAIPYHIGFLAMDAAHDTVASEVARMARHLSNGTMPISRELGAMEHGMGIGTLTQRKLGDEMYEYIFVKARHVV